MHLIIVFQYQFFIYKPSSWKKIIWRYDTEYVNKHNSEKNIWWIMEWLLYQIRDKTYLTNVCFFSGGLKMRKLLHKLGQ